MAIFNQARTYLHHFILKLRTNETKNSRKIENSLPLSEILKDSQILFFFPNMNNFMLLAIVDAIESIKNAS